MASNDNVTQEAEIVYKTKIVQFLGRSVPIILQNDNGPCPLLAICNVLLLRNNVNLSLDAAEVASSRLLSLVAERLLDSNSNIENKDEEYARNQQQNISDALSLLHHLATGLDVNVRFRNIHDFEFTPECAVFDLLDIGLVHGWLCDPQDKITSNILAANSYNTLVEKLVELQTTRTHTDASDSVDFVAATTATLGIPSPSRAVLLKTKSFEDADISEVMEQAQRKGDAEEKAQLLEALKLSTVDMLQDAYHEEIPALPSEQPSGNPDEKVQTLVFISGSESSLSNNKEDWCLIPPDEDLKNSNPRKLSKNLGRGEGLDITDSFVTVERIENGQGQSTNAAASKDSLPVFNDGSPDKSLVEVLEFQRVALEENQVFIVEDASAGEDSGVSKGEDAVECQPDFVEQRSSDCTVDLGAPTTSSFAASTDLLYEGEAEAFAMESREPLYEGEASLGECHMPTGTHEGVIINNFLKTNASQLTYYGLFCLQEGLKERELCVFFRNNHFSTMFKYNGDLYLLVTDQGYLNQPDIVWEKLDEVHGDTVFVTGNFTPFQADGNTGLWDEQCAIAATADYLSSQDGRAKESGVNNSDLELAMSLQHQEFEQQQQARTIPSVPVRHQPQMTDSTMRADGSRLITGPKKSSYTYRPEAKTDTKSKCAIM